MVLCGAFSLAPVASPKPSPKSRLRLDLQGSDSWLSRKSGIERNKSDHVEDVPTVFTFQLSPGGSRGSFTPGVVDDSLRYSGSRSAASSSIRSRGDSKSMARRDDNTENCHSSHSSRKRRRPENSGQLINVRKALFDAATESESVSDPLVGSIVGGPEAKEAARKIVADDTPSKKQLLWHAALKSHRSRHGKHNSTRQSSQQQKQQQQQQLPETLRERHQKLQELDSVIIQHCNDSKESLTSCIRKRGLKNIEQYLPSMSDSKGNSYERLYQNSKESVDRLQVEKQKKKKNRSSKYCPLCSSRLTYLYSSKQTKRLAEIHSGSDSPSSKADSVLPPYCIGCRAYLVYESWDEKKRRKLLGNFERGVGLSSPLSTDRGASPLSERGPLEDFRNGRLVVVNSASSDGMDAETPTSSSSSEVSEHEETPKISNSSSEVSSLHIKSNEDFVQIDGLHTASSSTNSNRAMPEHYGQNEEVLTPTQPYRRKGRMMVDSNSFESVEDEKREDCEAYDQDQHVPYYVQDGVVGGDMLALEVNTAGSSIPNDKSDDDPFLGLKTPVNEIHGMFTDALGPSDENENYFAAETGEQNAHNIQAPTTPYDSKDRPSYQIIDQAITFKSPTIAEQLTDPPIFKSASNAAKKHIQTAQLAVASTFSEEFAMFQNYSVKKEAATLQIAKCLYKGYELTPVKCDQCEMPMMTRGEEGMVCVSCPAIMKRVRRLVREKRGNGMPLLPSSMDVEEKRSPSKTPKVSNGYGRLDLGEDASHDEERMDHEDGLQFHNDFHDLSEVREDTLCDDIDERSIDLPEVDPQTNFHQTCMNDDNLDRLEAGTIYCHLSQKYYSQNQRQSNQLLPVDTREHWAAHSARRVGHNHPPLQSQKTTYYPSNPQRHDPLANEIQQQNRIQQQSSYHDYYASEQFHPNCHYQQPSHPENTQHQNGADESNQKDIHQQSSYHNINVASFESGQESYHNNSSVNGESVESVTKCPRNLPQSEQIWHYYPSHERIAHISQADPTRSFNSNDHLLFNGRALSAAGPWDRGEHFTQPDFQVIDTPRNDKIRALWDECNHVSYQLNASLTHNTSAEAAKQIWSAPQQRAMHLQVEQRKNTTERLSTPIHLFEEREMPSSLPQNHLYATNGIDNKLLSANEKHVKGRLDYLNKLSERAPDQFKPRVDECQHEEHDTKGPFRDPDPLSPSEPLHHSVPVHVGQTAFDDKEDLQNEHTNSRLKTQSPLQIRKPLEPLERDSDINQHLLYFCNRGSHGMVSGTPRRPATDPPGIKSVGRADDVQRFVRGFRNNRRSNSVRSQCNKHKGKEKGQVGREPATAEPTPSDSSILIMNTADVSSKNTPALELQVNQQGSPSNGAALQNKFDHVRTPKSRGTAFRLNIPSWVDHEIDNTPIEPVKSFGESSMDQLMRKIDEIENDFSTIVASLPGSDGFSLGLTKTDDNSTLASKPSFELDREIERVQHQLATNSFESHESQEKLSGLLQQMRFVQNQIERLDSSELDDGSEGGYESQGEMAELIQRLANAAESLRSLQIE